MCLPPCVPSSDLHFLAVGATLAQIGIGPSAAPPSSASAARLPPLPAVLPPKKLGVAVDAASVPIGAAAAAATATTEQVVAEASAGGGLMAYVVRKTLGEFLVAWTPLVRQAAAAWVHGLLTSAGSHDAVREAATDVQRGLISLLADPMEATQELAAKSLSLLFESCDAPTQVHLVT